MRNGNLLKSLVSEIRVKWIRINQGVGVLCYLPFSMYSWFCIVLKLCTANVLLEGSPNRALKLTVTFDNNSKCQKQVWGQIKESIFCMIWHLISVLEFWTPQPRAVVPLSEPEMRLQTFPNQLRHLEPECWWTHAKIDKNCDSSEPGNHGGKFFPLI